MYACFYVCVHHIPHQLSNDLTFINQLECCVSLFFVFFFENIHEYIMYVLCTFLLYVYLVTRHWHLHSSQFELHIFIRKYCKNTFIKL